MSLRDEEYKVKKCDGEVVSVLIGYELLQKMIHKLEIAAPLRRCISDMISRDGAVETDKARLQKLVEAERPTCAICHEDFGLGETLRCLPACDHTYHASCIGHWLRIKAACPLCQQKVLPP